jgi:pyruvate/2-oxoglutarate dehydrogenase complex dihydrolipoamide dehydrogenase (E3) component
MPNDVFPLCNSPLSIDSQELINLVALAMRHYVTASDLRDTIYNHPSSTEVLNEVLANTA